MDLETAKCTALKSISRSTRFIALWLRPLIYHITSVTLPLITASAPVDISTWGQIHLCRQSPVSSMGCAGLLAFLLRASSESTGRTGQKCRGLMPTENNAPPVGGSGCTDGQCMERRLSIGFSEVLAEVSPYGWQLWPWSCVLVLAFPAFLSYSPCSMASLPK